MHLSKRNLTKKLFIAIYISIVLASICVSQAFAELTILTNSEHKPGYDLSLIVQNAANSGAATYAFPIVVPAGRAGLTPDIKLAYSSNAKNSWVGFGWSLQMGAIQRSTKNGLNYGGNEFVVITGSAAEELVARSADWGVNFYGAKLESEFTRYEYLNSNGWIATTRAGLTYHYGTTSASRQENGGNVFKWCLDRIEDTNGNYIEINYVKNQGQIYLNEVKYTGHATELPTNSIQFVTESRSDATLSYTCQSNVTTANRLKTIEINTSDGLASRYQLNYQYSSSSERSLLSSIEHYGSDGTTTLPATHFQTQAGGPGTYTSIATNTVAHIPDLSNVYLVDINGDHLSDLINFAYNDIRCHLANGSGGFNGAEITSCQSGYGAKRHFADINGDGYTDIIVHTVRTLGNVSNILLQTYLSNGNGTFSYAGAVALGEEKTGSVAFGDFNGDAKSDLVFLETDTNTLQYYQSDGSGNFRLTASIDVGPRGSELFAADVNSDGRDDLLVRYYHAQGNGEHNRLSVYTNHIGIWLSQANSSFGHSGTISLETGAWEYGHEPVGVIGKFHWVELNGDGHKDLAIISRLEAIATYLSKGNGNFTDRIQNSTIAPHGSVYFGEVNGDGLSDLIFVGYNMITYKADGQGHFVHYSQQMPSNGIYNPFITDVTGDGLTDIVSATQPACCNPPTSDFQIYKANGNGAADVVTRITEDAGLAEDIVYTADTRAYSNSNLPFVAHLVDRITVSDSFSVTQTTQYDYTGGVFDRIDREFRGFATVTATRSDGSKIETRYHQDDYRKGKAHRETLRSDADTDLTRTDTVWPEISGSPAWAFVRPDSRQTIYYDSPTVSSREDYTYNANNGNLLQVTASGSGGANVISEYGWENKGDWLWRKSLERIRAADGTLVRETNFFHAAGTGNLTAKAFWLSGGVNPRIEYTYDAYGNLTAERDARGHEVLKVA